MHAIMVPAGNLDFNKQDSIGGSNIQYITQSCQNKYSGPILVQWINCIGPWWRHIDGLVQERCNSSVLAVELHLSGINLSIWCHNASGK